MSSSQTYFSTSKTTLVAIIFFITLSSTAAAAPPPTPLARPFSRIFAFGDSFTDTGNTRSSTGPTGFQFVSNPPYGVTFFHKPTNRYSDGRLVVDFLATYLNLPFLPPYLNKKADRSHGVNFAVAGATAISFDFFKRNNLSLDVTPESIGTQLVWFSKYLESGGCSGHLKVEDCLGDDLFWVGEIGINDYAYNVGGEVSNDLIQKLGVQSLYRFLKGILSKGAKYIVVQGLPPSGCLPLTMVLAQDTDRDSIGCVASANNRTLRHNLDIKARLHDLRAQFPHSVILYADYWNAYRDVMKDPEAHGFREPFKACCGAGGGRLNYDIFDQCGSPGATACERPGEYVNWDGVHLTEAMYKVVFDKFVRRDYIRPSFDYLLKRRRQHSG
uniref:Uncharacterized protein n=1 Tax=Kalanchoe fedtschenkoi TaxID=63787 RepID=A0A7N1A911_KALFE